LDIRYYIDADTGLPHISAHGVTEAEAEQVLLGSGEDLPGTRGSRLKLGQTHAGRYLQVVYAPDVELNGVFVITAYELAVKVKQAFRRRRRRRGQ